MPMLVPTPMPTTPTTPPNAPPPRLRCVCCWPSESFLSPPPCVVSRPWRRCLWHPRHRPHRPRRPPPQHRRRRRRRRRYPPPAPLRPRRLLHTMDMEAAMGHIDLFPCRRTVEPGCTMPTMVCTAQRCSTCTPMAPRRVVVVVVMRWHQLRMAPITAVLVTLHGMPRWQTLCWR